MARGAANSYFGNEPGLSFGFDQVVRLRTSGCSQMLLLVHVVLVSIGELIQSHGKASAIRFFQGNGILLFTDESRLDFAPYSTRPRAERDFICYSLSLIHI